MDQLTRREREVAALVAEGMSNKQIAARLMLSDHTIKTYVSAALRKMDARNRVDLARHVLMNARPFSGA